MADQTFALDGTPSPTSRTDTPADRTLGGTTVLPRLEVQGSTTTVVESTLPRFEMTGTLGAGGLGEVLGARDRDIGRPVAIKRIRPDRMGRSAFLRFVHEVRTVGRLDHPNIVPIHDVARDPDGEFFFVMKHVQGRTLAALIQALREGDGPTHAAFPFERRVELFRQLCHAVDFTHANGVVHRDLKPDNVMIGDHGEVTLIDFGIAKTDDAPDPEEGQLMGTPRYMAPEQARGEPVDARTDIYALCLILYELLGTRHPLEGLEGVDAVLQAVAADPAHPNPAYAAPLSSQGRIPADLGWIAMGGLSADPSQRYATVGELLTRLQRRAEGEIDVECAVTFQLRLVYRLRQLVHRHPLGLVALGVVAVACLVATGTLAGLALGTLGGLAL